MKVIIFIHALIEAVWPKCGEGCLRCSEKEECELCDLSNFYVLDGARECVLKEIKNCVKINSSGNCVLCQPHTFLTGEPKMCQPVPPNQLIANCVYYEPDKTCKLCERDYYSAKLLCHQSQKPITKCIYMLSEGICHSCEEGHVLSEDSQTCVAQPDLHGCIFEFLLTCRQCDADYLMNPHKVMYDMIFNLDT